MNIKDFRIRLFIFSFLAFGILAGIAGYAVWLDQTLLKNLYGQILAGAAPAAWLLFYLIGIAVLPAGLDEGGAAAADIKKKLFRMRLLVLSFIFFCIVYAAFGTALHNHLIVKGDEWLKQALLYGPPAVWLLFYLVAGTLAPIPSGAEKPAPEPVQPPAETEQEEARGAEAAEPEETPEYVHEEQGPDEEEIRETAVVQVLGLLQREGRLIDFLQEDIEPYEDAQIGAAVREVHRGCRAVLRDSLGLVPVLDAQEGTEVEVDEDFDPAKIKLTGNVHGEPPFRGILRHCGWQAAEIRLPVQTGDIDRRVIAPAEVEI